LTPEEEAQLESPAVAVSNQIYEMAYGRDYDNGARGWANIKFDIPTNSVELWWKGELDEDVERSIAEARAAGVTVVVHPVRRTLEATLKQFKHLKPALKARGITFIGAGPSQDRSTIRVFVLKDPKKSQLPGEAAKRRAAVRTVSEEATGLEVSDVEEWDERPQNLVGHAPAGLFDSKPCATAYPECRQNDVAPFVGGAAIRTIIDGDYSFCTTGFAVKMHQSKGWSDIARMITAAHCDATPENPSGIYTNGHGGTYTTSAGIVHPLYPEQHHMDAMILNPLGSVAGQMYAGAAGEASSGFLDDVIASKANLPGMVLRTSGANTGQHNNVIVSTDDEITFDPCYDNSTRACNHLIIAYQAQSLHDDYNPDYVIAAKGDSGGPLYSPGTISRQVYAHGIIKAGVGQGFYCNAVGTENDVPTAFPSPSLFEGTGYKCFTKIYFSPIQSMDKYWGDQWALWTP
jgi:hypothetical protein